MSASPLRFRRVPEPSGGGGGDRPLIRARMLKTMDKDLRDAYKALTLVRTDLVTTKKEKKELEERLHEAQEALEQQKHAWEERVCALHEALRMQEEDYTTQLDVQQRVYQQKVAVALFKNEMLMEELRRVREVEEHVPVQASQVLVQEEEEEDAVPTEEQAGEETVVREKLELLSNLYTLQAQLQEQTEHLVEQDACIAQEREDWTLQVDALMHQITQLQTTLLEVENEKQFMEEKFEFLRTEVDVIKQERDDLKAQADAAEKEKANVMARLEAFAREQEEAMSKLQAESGQMQRNLEEKVLGFETELDAAKEVLRKAEEERHVLEESMTVQREVTIRAQEEEAKWRSLAHYEKERASTAREELLVLRKSLEEHETQLKELKAERDSTLEAKEAQDQKLLRLSLELTTLNQEIELIIEAKTTATTRADALETELAEAKAAADRVEAVKQGLVNSNRSLEDEKHALASQVKRMARELGTWEQRWMELEDPQRHELSAEPTSWSALQTQIRGLQDFLPQLQLLTGRLQTSLVLCDENVVALDAITHANALRVSNEASMTSLPTDLNVVLRVVSSWKAFVEQHELSHRVRVLRRRVLMALSEWYECALDELPPPSFGINSREVALILQNWTSDLEQQRSVLHWLTRMTKPAISEEPNSEDDEDDDDRVPVDGEADAINGKTLRLRSMTREVKDAFLMLVVPILRQPPQQTVRVFTRRVADAKTSYSPEEKSWEMMLHVHTNKRSVSLHSTSLVHPSLPRVSSTSSLSSVSSSLSMASTSSSSLSSLAPSAKLQLIQARLQRLQQPHQTEEPNTRTHP
ncbi:hypothetical protein Poli38472_012783 [Pythium oligandrum]|uniref:Uncharacterized protein n=1 Tax=Pythium oligandrum TaxID=41045 RepID=A0A8K1FJA7_PYTOL|nr:hypothetical protein Poli38472_012783 [Pythium oligandrum]|eukprot:TMW61592.1 hypothetical protein Poli38472_012783 [Pythium oligandrum]